MRSSAAAHRLRLGHDVMIAVWQRHVLARQQPQVVVDHRKQLEPCRKALARTVQLAQGQRGAGRGAGTAAERLGRHRDGIGDVACYHQAGRGRDMQNLGADARSRRRAGRDGLVGAVDVVLRAFARDPQDRVAEPIDPVGQPVQPLRLAPPPGQCRDPRDDRGDVVLHAHLLPLLSPELCPKLSQSAKHRGRHEQRNRPPRGSSWRGL